MTPKPVQETYQREHGLAKRPGTEFIGEISYNRDCAVAESDRICENRAALSPIVQKKNLTHLTLCIRPVDMGKIRSLFGSERGATMVEHAIILPIFLLLIFSVVDLCYFSFNALTLQFGISRAMRAAAIDPGMSAAQMRSSLESALAGLGVKLEPQDHVSLCPVSISNTCGETSIIAGDQNELMVLRIRKKFGSLFVNFIAPFLTLNAEAVGRNEPQ